MMRSFSFGVSNISSLLYEEILKYDHVEIVYDDTYGSLDKCESAVVMSGTASLEVALTILLMLLSLKLLMHLI